jgi:type IV pilus assembly protein PilX
MNGAARVPASRRQRGAVLAIALVVLLLVAIVGAATLRTARLGLAMAGNAQARQQAFHVAEATLDATLATVAADTPALQSATACPPGGLSTLPGEAVTGSAALPGDAVTRLCFRGLDTHLVPGSSVGRIHAVHYELQADVQSPARGARAVLVRGFHLLQPAGED